MSARIPVTQLPDDTMPGDGIKVCQLFQSPQHYPVQLNEEKIYTRRIHGFFQRLRRYITAPLLLAFFLIPWLRIDDRPAIFLDLSAQKFHVFWMTFWPQDGMLLTWMLIIAALGLFAVTAQIGRVWCGFSCPHTVWTQMFIWLEDKCEGDRQQRIKLDVMPWGAEKLLRKGIKHTLWVTLALISGLTFISYFYDARELARDIINVNMGLDALFWSGFFTVATYINAGWMREKFCKFVCPYSQFQSVMYDAKTKTVAYDAVRGDSFIDATSGEVIRKSLITQDALNHQAPNHQRIEMKRLARNPKVDHQAAGLGDCIDCGWCVQVCPVGIDIRNGLQADCISCGLCIDACDSIMDHMHYDRGLIRFASQEGLTGSVNKKKKNFIPTPRSVAYSLALLIICGLFVTELVSREPLDVSIVRDRGVHLYRERNDRIENVYYLRLGNMSRKVQDYHVSVLPPYTLKGRSKVALDEGEMFNFPLRVVLHKNQIASAHQRVTFQVRSLVDDAIVVRKTAAFISPSSIER